MFRGGWEGGPEPLDPPAQDRRGPAWNRRTRPIFNWPPVHGDEIGQAGDV